MNKRPSDQSLARITNFVAKYCEKSGTTTHPDAATTFSMQAPSVSASFRHGRTTDTDSVGSSSGETA